MSLILGAENFGQIFCATGARGFYGEGYPFHKLWKYTGMNWRGTGFSGKTLTLESRRGQEFGEPGNMPLEEDGVTPKELMPRSIWTSFRNGGEMVNAVGLAGFGARFYLQTGNFHRIKKPFSLSFMTLANDASGREAELREFCVLLRGYLPFKTSVVLQINFGCPNSGHDLSKFYSEICGLVEIAKSILGIPVIPNVNALMPTSVLVEIARIADGLWIGNTIPWKSTDQIDWSRYGERSPVRNQLDPIRWEWNEEKQMHLPVEMRKKDAIDGGLSSPVCLPITIEKVQDLRDSGVTVPIIAGNGIRTRKDISDLKEVRCNAVFVGSLAVVRPHRMKGIISFAHETFR
jgi:dihydroorotate dehydrogenase